MKDTFRTLLGFIIIILIIGLAHKWNYSKYQNHIIFVKNFLVTMQNDENKISSFLKGERVDSVKDNEQLLEQIQSIGEIRKVILLSVKFTKRNDGNDTYTNLIVIGSKRKITLVNVRSINKTEEDFKITELYVR